MADRPRLLVITSTLPRWEGDTEPRFVLDLARAMADRFEPVILAPMAQGAAARETLDGVRIERYRYAPARRIEKLAAPGAIMPNLRTNPWLVLLVPGFFLGQLIALVLLLRRERFAAIHCHWLIPQGLVVAIASLFAPAPPALLTCHGADAFTLDSAPMRALKRWILKRFATVTVVSKEIAQSIAPLGCAEPVHLPMGVDLTCFGGGERCPGPAPVILYAGRLAEKKGVHHLIEAMADERLRNRGARLRIVGTGPLQADLERLSQRLGLGAAVEFLGPRPHAVLASEMQSATLFCAPFVIAADGDREGTPTVLLEAAAASLPIVTSNIGGCGEIIETGRTGWLLPPGNRAALIDAIVEAIDDPLYAAVIAAAARREAECRSWPRIAAGYGDALFKIIQVSQKENGNVIRI